MYHTRNIKSADIVFLGDSLTEWFDLDTYFPGGKDLNRGISGDTTEGIIYRYDEILNAGTDKLFLMIGINDIFQGVPEERIEDNIEKILADFFGMSARTVIYLQSILPVNEARLIVDEDINTTIYRLNNKFRMLAKKYKAKYLDLHIDFLNTEGQMSRDFTYDGVHLSMDGYILWAELIKEYV
ncbi:MAG: sialate O-acetylesterase [Bacteroidales bacterium]|nr:sialate O-acetylesterase [Bacteroidales bacterium]